MNAKLRSDGDFWAHCLPGRDDGELRTHMEKVDHSQLGPALPFSTCPALPTDSASTETSILETVAQLTKLRSLCLYTVLDPDTCTRVALAPHATSVACLSALTALTRLEFEPSPCYEFHGDRWSVMHKHGLALEEPCEAHRTSLLAALRAMPQLQHLHCPTLWLRPSEAAPLTALTTLSVGGLLRPSPAGAGHRAHLAADMEVDPVPESDNGPEDPAREGPLPTGLQELRLINGASPCTLAALQLPASVRSFRCAVVILGCRDVEQLECITQEALEALGPAMRLLSRQEICCASDTVQVVVDGGPGLLQPRQDTPTGHAEWLQQLAGLGAFQSLQLRGVELRAGDVGCLVRMWPKVRVSLEPCLCPNVRVGFEAWLSTEAWVYQP